MSSGRRLAKRSIIGSRVCAPGRDGRYYPGVIQATRSRDVDSAVYSVLLDEQQGRVIKEFRDAELIGPGFQNVTSCKLRPGQRVFITHNSREVQGRVSSHWPHIDQVVISIKKSEDDETESEISKRLEEVRLLESRKSARLQEQPDQDYSRISDGMEVNPSRKRATSHVIDVPSGQRKRRPSSPQGDVGADIMDDCAAAMVLMSLSCSPKSPRLPGYDSGYQLPCPWTDGPQSPGSSSGASSWDSGKSAELSVCIPPLPAVYSSDSSSSSSSARTSSPPAQVLITGGHQYSKPSFGLSESAPAGLGHTNHHRISSSADEGIDVDDGPEDDDSVPRKRRTSTRIMYQCTWPGCGRITVACSAIEKHVRTAHLGPKCAEDSDLSDHEEEFYFTEIEVGVDTIGETINGMYTSSPPTLSHMDMARPPTEDPEYLKQLQGSPQKYLKIHPKSGNSFLKPPGSLLRRPRSEGSKKCRKIYGMENRDLWCTQCKWKKACTRFID